MIFRRKIYTGTTALIFSLRCLSFATHFRDFAVLGVCAELCSSLFGSNFMHRKEVCAPQFYCQMFNYLIVIFSFVAVISSNKGHTKKNTTNNHSQLTSLC